MLLSRVMRRCPRSAVRFSIQKLLSMRLIFVERVPLQIDDDRAQGQRSGQGFKTRSIAKCAY